MRLPAQRPCLLKGRPCRRRMSGDPLPPRARARRVADPEDFGLFSLGRAAAQAPPCDCLPKGRARPRAAPPARPRHPIAPAAGAAMRLPAQRPRLPKGRACPKAAPAQRPRLLKGRPCRRRRSGDPRPPRARARRGADPEEFGLFSLGRAAAQAPPCDCLPRGRACPNAIARPRAAPVAGGCPGIRAPAGAGAPRRRPGGVRAIQPRARRGAGAAMRLPAQGPCPPRGRARPRAAPAQGPRLPKCRARPARCPAARAPLPQADLRGSAPPAGAGAPRIRPGGFRAIQPRARRSAGAAMRLPAQGPRLPKGRARPGAAPAQRPLPAQGPRLPKGP